MATLVGRQLKRRFALPYACYKLLTKRQAFIKESGWIESIRHSRPCDQHGDPVPWMNYSVVEFFQERLTEDMRVFEFGSGYSTCFFAKQCRDVIAVEHDHPWFERVQKIVPGNAHVFHCELLPDGLYCRSICGFPPGFDLVMVDGRDRVNCVKQAAETLSPSGILALDDSDRPRYSHAFEIMISRGYRHLTLSGLKPGNPCRNQTTIFYKDGNGVGL